MCSRFELLTPIPTLRTRFSVDIAAVPNNAEVRPTDLGLVIGASGGKIQPWGLKPFWEGGGPLINARCESLDQKPSFKGLVQRRVLIPATSWWEWTRDAKDRPDRKVRLRLKDHDLFAFAGLTDDERFTIITCDAVPEMMELNDRMPVILPEQVWANWLSPSVSFETVKGHLRPQSGLVLEPDEQERQQLSLF
jgi:putative SOS response-associated peptidase YedK